jgi:predicted transcriptional regulator of viral defense system
VGGGQPDRPTSLELARGWVGFWAGRAEIGGGIAGWLTNPGRSSAGHIGEFASSARNPALRKTRPHSATGKRRVGPAVCGTGIVPGMTIDRSAERHLLILMARQHGLATTVQARAVGVGKHRLARLTVDGYIRQVAPGLYRQLGAQKTFEHFVMTACLAVRGALASHQTAAALHLGPDYRRREVHVVVPHGTHARDLVAAGIELVVHRTRSLSSSDECKVAGIPTTAPARTLLDLAALPASSGRGPGLDQVLGELLATKRVQPASVLTALKRARSSHHAGRAQLERTLERALELDIVRTESPPERRFLLMLACDGMPLPAVQHEIRGPRGGLICRADFAWPAFRLVIEIDGSRWHSSLEAQARDRARDARLQAAGWTVLRFSPADIAERPQRVLASVCELLDMPNPLR